jgi:hypothetical protein
MITMLSELDPMSYEFASLANPWLYNNNYPLGPGDVPDMGCREVGRIMEFWNLLGLEKWIPESPLREVSSTLVRVVVAAA